MGAVVTGEDVQPDRPLEVGHVEVAHLVRAPARNVGEHRLGGVAERIDQAHPFPAGEVLGDHAMSRVDLPLPFYPARRDDACDRRGKCQRPQASVAIPIRRPMNVQSLSFIRRRQPSPAECRRKNTPGLPGSRHIGLCSGNASEVCPIPRFRHR
jgi:hypothetical protein